MRRTVSILTIIMIFSVISFAQDFRTPRPSPDATVSQFVGVTNITIDYSSPAVKDRKIWGGLVPFGEVWRTGANEATTITFTDAVIVDGNELASGTYGIHCIPNANEWEVIFSKDTKIDGSSTFDPKKEALRIKVKPEEHHFMERMTFLFTDATETSVNVSLNWEKLHVSFKVDVKTQDITLQKARDAFKWNQLMAGATYCLDKNINMDEGFKWIQASTLINENYWNKRILAQYYSKMNKKSEAIATMESAVELGNKMPNAPFDFDRMKQMLVDWKVK
ncbi:MAG: DUF2911 domain-containing protein [Ignavibacteriales bacterium]|nr:DUF2911 domain-containing protein [Ignavibacteriales bacterium]